MAFDARWESDLEALGWLERSGFARICQGTPGAAGRGSTVRRTLPSAGVDLLVRRVLHGGLLGGLFKAALRSPARALDELRVTAELRAAGAPVPRPALAAARRAGLAWNALVATVLEPDASDGLEWLAGSPGPEAVRAATVACARAVRRFHDAGGTHADLHVKNLLLREIPGTDGFEAVIVDLDGARFGAAPGPGRRMHELARLYRSGLKRGVDERLGLEGHRAFLQAYVDDDVGLGAALARHWPRERRRVALHALGYSSRDRIGGDR